MSLLDTLASAPPRQGALAPLGVEAAATLQELGLPTKKTEAWRFTSVRELVSADLAPAPLELAPTAAPPSGHDVVSFRGGHARFVPPGATTLVLGRLADGAGSEHLRVGAAFAALNSALFADGVVARVTGAHESPLFFDYEGIAGHAAYPRALVVLEANAELTLVERFRGQSSLTSAVLEVVLGPGAKLTHLRTHEDEGALLGAVDVRQARDSVYASHVFSFGGAPARLDLGVHLEGEGAECRLDGVYVAAGATHLDHHVRVDHRAPRSRSAMRYRGLARERATAIFDGQSHVHPGAVGCEAHQQNRNLLVDPTATVHTKPHLEIHVDEVVASHGATVGALDEDALFYARSRGLPESEARALLTYAFLKELVDAVDGQGGSALRAAMRDALLSQLPGGEALGALEEELS